MQSVDGDAAASDAALIQVLHTDGNLLNVLGDCPTLTDPVTRATSVACGTPARIVDPKAVAEGLNTRQIDEIQVLNLDSNRPDRTC